MDQYVIWLFSEYGFNYLFIIIGLSLLMFFLWQFFRKLI